MFDLRAPVVFNCANTFTYRLSSVLCFSYGFSFWLFVFLFFSLQQINQPVFHVELVILEKNFKINYSFILIQNTHTHTHFATNLLMRHTNVRYTQHANNFNDKQNTIKVHLMDNSLLFRSFGSATTIDPSSQKSSLHEFHGNR